MCGIIGVIGDDPLAALLDGLSRLEYRGYDSVGVAVLAGGELWRIRAAGGGALVDLRSRVGKGELFEPSSSLTPGRSRGLPPGELVAAAGIGHTRWATHGAPTEQNAHPHSGCTGRIALAHNGIIENHRELAARLQASGHTFTSDTDTEVLVHLLEENEDGDGLAASMRRALRTVQGTFAIVAVSISDPDVIVAARRVSPLIVGIGVDRASGYVASDLPALLGRADCFYSLEDDQVAEVGAGSFVVTGLSGEPATPHELKSKWTLEDSEKAGYETFMEKEMAEQPDAISDTLRSRLRPDGFALLDDGLASAGERASALATAAYLDTIERITILACGSSLYAAMAARPAFETWANVPTDVEIASEYRYRSLAADARTLAIAMSQSGETTDTLQAARAVLGRGLPLLAVTNVVGSSLSREAQAVCYTRAGPEIGVAATKTLTTQIAILQLLAAELGQRRRVLDRGDVARISGSLARLPALVGKALAHHDEVREVAARIGQARDFFYLGRGVGYPVALEGALKLKEIAYVHAEGYPAGEMKHGPIACFEPGTVVVAVATRGPLWEKMMGNIAEARARRVTMVVVCEEGDRETAEVADEVLTVPSAPDPLTSPVIDVIAMQLLAYEIARGKGLDVDRPRNLAKTVTVE